MVSRGVSRAFHNVLALSCRLRRSSSLWLAEKRGPRALSSSMSVDTLSGSVAEVMETSGVVVLLVALAIFTIRLFGSSNEIWYSDRRGSSTNGIKDVNGLSSRPRSFIGGRIARNRTGQVTGADTDEDGNSPYWRQPPVKRQHHWLPCSWQRQFGSPKMRGRKSRPPTWTCNRYRDVAYQRGCLTTLQPWQCNLCLMLPRPAANVERFYTYRSHLCPAFARIEAAFRDNTFPFWKAA